MPDSASTLNTVVFDLGAVVLKWDPERAFAQVLPAEQVAAFMNDIDFPTWNRAHDAGQLFDVGEQALIERLPESRAAILAYRKHFAHTLTGMVEGTGAVMAELALAGVRLIALTNWSAETFPHAQSKFSLLERFEGIVVSGAEGLAKPDPAIFELVVRRFGLDPVSCVFIDDSAPNVEAAAALGITAIQFRDAGQLRTRLVQLGLLGKPAPVDRPIYHITERRLWDAAQAIGEFPWSSRNLTYERQGFVHCSFADQVDGVLDYHYCDLARTDLVLLELDPNHLGVPVIVEDLGAGRAYPHIYAPLPVAGVSEVHDVADVARLQ